MHPGVHAAARPDKPAVVMAGTGEVVTYGELDAESCRLARLFADLGLRPGDHMALMVENHPRFMSVLWAAHRCGLYYTAVSTRLTPGELAYVLNDCEAKAFVTSAAVRDVAAAVVGDTPGVRARLMIGGTADGHDAYEDAIAAYPPEPPAEQFDGTDMLYSSGTTGRPKGVKPPLTVAPLGSLPDGVTLLCQALFGMDESSVYLTPAPLYHSAPLRFTRAVHKLGATAVVLERFDPVAALDAIERHRVTHSQWVPTMFIRMLKLPEEQRTARDLSSHRCAIHAAAPVPVPVKRQMIEWWGPIVHEYYAGTEGNGFVYCNSEDWLAHPGTVGRPLIGSVHVVGDDGEEVPAGRTGTIYFEGGAEFEYHKDPEKTASARHPKGWTTLGDIGHVDEEGFVYLTDRKAHMIITGGVNVYPQEAENVLATHPKVADVAVIGVPHEEFGEEVKAVVQPLAMEDAGPELERELVEFCRSQLADVKCPRSVDFRPELPRHPTGKLYKRLLKDEYWAGHETRVV
jgi:acyl-CoA synthetase (AMP-forming)/AMP-acid ligase II